VSSLRRHDTAVRPQADSCRKAGVTHALKRSAPAASDKTGRSACVCVCVCPADWAPAAAATNTAGTGRCAPADVDRMARKATRWLMAYSRPTQPCGPRPNVRKCLLQETSSLRSSLKRSGSNLCASLYPCACRAVRQAQRQDPRAALQIMQLLQRVGLDTCGCAKCKQAQHMRRCSAPQWHHSTTARTCIAAAVMEGMSRVPFRAT
jgi:hypothetical protein